MTEADMLREIAKEKIMEDVPTNRFVKAILEGAEQRGAKSVRYEMRPKKLAVYYVMDDGEQLVMTVPGASVPAVLKKLWMATKECQEDI